MQVFIYCKITLYMFRVSITPIIHLTWPIGHVGGRLLLRYYDLHQRLQLQFYVLLMMGAMNTGNM